MTFANINNTKVGDSVLIPIHGEFLNDEQIMLEYEVVIALKAKIKPESQIVGEGQFPLYEYYDFIDGLAYKL